MHTHPTINPDADAKPADRLREQVVSALVPFFLNEASDNHRDARAAAWHMVMSYNPVSGKQIQLSAQIVAFCFAALDCLRCSMERDMPVRVLLRLRGSAVALNRLGNKCHKILEAQRRAPDAVELEEAEFRAAIDKARQLMTDARAKLQAHRADTTAGALNPPAPHPQAVQTPAKRAATKKSVSPGMAAEPMTLQVLARRKEVDQTRARHAAQLSRLSGRTKH